MMRIIKDKKMMDNIKIYDKTSITRLSKSKEKYYKILEERK